MQTPGRAATDPQARRWPILSAGVLGGIGVILSVLCGVAVAASSRITYYLPSPDGSEATEHQDWFLTRLWALPLALAGLVLAGWVLWRVVSARREGRGLPAWVALLALVSLLLGPAALLLAASMDPGTY